MDAISNRAVLSAAALALLAGLAGCGERSDGETVGQKVDAAVQKSGQAAREAKQEAREGVASAADATRDKARDAGAAAREKTADAGASARDAKDDARTSVMGAASATRDKADGAGSKADDVRISSSVKAGLEAEKELRGATVDVDTQDGVVTLSGAVPTAAAKARANEIARGIKDVKSVNNQLTLAAS